MLLEFTHAMVMPHYPQGPQGESLFDISAEDFRPPAGWEQVQRVARELLVGPHEMYPAQLFALLRNYEDQRRVLAERFGLLYGPHEAPNPERPMHERLIFPRFSVEVQLMRRALIMFQQDMQGRECGSAQAESTLLYEHLKNKGYDDTSLLRLIYALKDHTGLMITVNQALGERLLHHRATLEGVGAAHERALARLREELEATRGELGPTRDDREAAEIQAAALREGLAGANAALETVRAELADTLEELDEARTERNEAQAVLNEARAERNHAERQVATLVSEVAALETRLAQARLPSP